MRISELISEAQSEFQALTTVQLSSNASTTIAELCRRYSDWTRHVGPNYSGRDSLEYTLKDSARLQGTVSELLEDLVGELNECALFVRAWTRDSTSITSDFAQSSSSSQSTDRPQISVTNSPIAELESRPSPESELLQDVEETIDLLERLVKTILDHEPHDYMEREFMERVQHSETQDSWKVHRRFPDASVYIQQRLGRAIAKRRAIMFYHVKRKLSRENIESTESSVETILGGMRTTLIELAERDDQQDTRSSSEMSTSSEDSGTANNTDCTLCDQPINTEDCRLFRKHLYEDLEPYVCLYQDCPSPERLYRSRGAWTEHVKFVHGAIWRCCFGCTQTFGARSSFEAHLNEEHLGHFSNKELPSLAQLCEKHVLLDDDTRCPLCKDVTTFGSRRQRHIGKHMEDLALCALELVDGLQTKESTNYGYPVREGDTASITSQDRTRSTGGSIFPSTARTSIGGDDDEDTMSDIALRNRHEDIASSLKRKLQMQSAPEYDAASQRADRTSPPPRVVNFRPRVPEGKQSLTTPELSTIGTQYRSSKQELPKDRVSGSSLGFVKRTRGKDEQQKSKPRTASNIGSDLGISSVPPSTAKPMPYRTTQSPVDPMDDIQPSCAICGASPYPECPHEGQRLELALDQASERWGGLQHTRNWVLNRSREQVIATFQKLKAARYEAHGAYLQTLPCYALYQRYHGNPPLQPSQLHLLHHQINQATSIFKVGVDEDWRRSCLLYPDVLDYFFNLVQITFPDEKNPSVRELRLWEPLERAKRAATVPSRPRSPVSAVLAMPAKYIVDQ